jgi:hypothetical protein
VRQHAAECRELSAKAPTPEIREHFGSIAKMWDKLAAERLQFFIVAEPEPRAAAAANSPSTDD